MNKNDGLNHHLKELEKLGWHCVALLHTDDLKDRINGGMEIVEMPSDYILNEALANVCRRFDVDITDYLDYAQELAMEWKQEETNGKSN